ncbi:DNA methyltransferase [Burkholderia ubonensis]|uniref:DNA adenine methylase n=1 Tax=Burkholderia ubonensis TaxID=101571 RepID=UPI00075CAA8F|nr:DNA adenine methylase [Burkholderia ubonensis]KVP59319.1 DNA methyltransferase [Burkholderia ubonensis]
MSDVTRPVLRYHGGKFRLAPWVIRHFPPHRCYVEPFGGAAGVLVQKERAYAEVYNDLDGDIVNLFRVLREPGQCARLIDLLQLTPYARDEFDSAYEATDDPIERARRTFVRAEMGFGSAGATKGSTDFRVDMRRKYGTAPQLWSRFPAELSRVCERLRGVMIENRPALDVVRQHDAPDTLFYVDPPYLMSTRNVYAERGRYYAHELTDADHLELLDELSRVAGMVVLSGYASREYDVALEGWMRTSTDARISSARGTAVREECLWMNQACVRELGRTGLFSEIAA